MKIKVTDYIHSDQEMERKELEADGHEFEALQLKFASPDTVYEEIANADILVVNMVPFPADFIRRLTKCKLIIRHGIGYDNVDVKACTEQGIQFAYQPAYCATEVAEHAITLVMCLTRKIFAARTTLIESSQRGDWNFDNFFPVRRLEGQTLGLLGLGRIGRIVARKAHALGLKVLACDPNVDPSEAPCPVEFVDRTALFERSDILSLHSLLNEDTREVVNAETLALMKPTAFLVNSARAGLIKTDDLVACLKQGAIAGAAIDVFDKEPPPADHPLFDLDNAILTPHMGWASVESGLQIRQDIISDIKSFASGGNARYVINKETLKDSV